MNANLESVPAPGADTAPESRWQKMTFDLDAGAGARAAIGLVTLSNDLTIEPELIRFLPDDGVALYSNRIEFPATATVATLRGMERDITAVTALINPGEKLDVVAFGCTSGTMAIGDTVVAERIRAARPEVKTTDPITAGLTGLDALGCRRIAVLTPYVDEVNDVVEAFIGAKGFDIAARASFKHLNSGEMCRISPESIYQAAMQIGSSDVDALFISCTALRVSPVLARIERDLAKPVVSSNQAMAWHAMRLAGCDDKVTGFGCLLEQ